MLTRFGALGPLAALALVAALALPGAAAGAPAWAPGRVLVGTADGVGAAGLARALGGEVVGLPRAGVVAVPARPGETVPRAVARLRAAPGVAWAEPDRIVAQEAAPD